MTLQEFVDDLNSRLESGDLNGNFPVRVAHLSIPMCTCEPSIAICYEYASNKNYNSYIIYGDLK